ncbi:hypothetical protein BC962_0852 [Gillisia mitskevichiae]|uniref:Uncharacterized protein n=1 Tax=Gillisia mitskevichiae TaxID=270921 RepID=A0A495PZC7_9FLAO|nr:hypothetical protein [Gillisia mitskevichiae]RKS55879.1 hypothetical protein BC962_0852 [Gillisia mitskevichiae]
MNKYEVLWVDDNAEEQDAFLESAYLEGINITFFKTSKLGMEELSSKIEYYEAVILDAMVYNETEDEKAGLIGLQNSIKKINSLADCKKIPYFIYSGYIDKDEHSSAREMLADENIFIKGKDNQALFKAIKEAADEQELTQLKHKYPNPFAVCEENYLGAKHFERVLQLIKDIENPENISNPQDGLLPIRKLLEASFDKLNKLGLIPDEIQNGNGAINGASYFLAGSNDQYLYEGKLIHPVIAESIRHLISLTQDASHNNGNKLGADTYLGKANNTFLYQSLCYSLLEVLDYLKPFIDANSVKSINQKKWELVQKTTSLSGEWVSGKITRISSNGYGTFQPDNEDPTLAVLPNKISEFLLKEDQKIEVTTIPSPCGTKTYIKEIKIVE